jgi:hypothetical protein
MTKVRRKKKADVTTEIILPILGCIFIVFVSVSFCLHFLLDEAITNSKTIINEDNAKAFGHMKYQRHETVDSNILSYDIHKCPPDIPKDYPYAWNTLEVLQHWNPDDTEIPSTIHQGLCAVDWNDPKQQKIAEHYRKHEVPFLVHNHPQIRKTANKWSSYDYMLDRLGDKTYRNEYSKNNHMMYWKPRGKTPPGWTPPTENVELSFPDWYEKAVALDKHPDPANAEHYYLRLSGAINSKNEWLYEDLPFFSPTRQSEVFMVDPTDERGINCRLGSKGTIAETHYDMSRNFILMLRGQKRYILAHPSQCINMELYPLGHPSARHTRINWSDPESWHDGENFPSGMVNEIVLQAGDGLYLPTYWLHFIVSLSMNYQCNARSGITHEYRNHVKKCGFA